jgi:hypothetical protein
MAPNCGVSSPEPTQDRQVSILFSLSRTIEQAERQDRRDGSQRAAKLDGTGNWIGALPKITSIEGNKIEVRGVPRSQDEEWLVNRRALSQP